MHLSVLTGDRSVILENNSCIVIESGRTAGGTKTGADESRAEAPAPPQHSAKSRKPSQRSAAKRRFSYRKVADLEDEIFERETCIESLQSELAEPSVLRDGERVRQIILQIEREQAALKSLYEHWEEAAELNW